MGQEAREKHEKIITYPERKSRLGKPLQDRRVDFLPLNFDEKSCYFRVFFVCFLTHCETEVLIF